MHAYRTLPWVIILRVYNSVRKPCPRLYGNTCAIRKSASTWKQGVTELPHPLLEVVCKR